MLSSLPGFAPGFEFLAPLFQVKGIGDTFTKFLLSKVVMLSIAVVFADVFSKRAMSLELAADR